MARTKGAKNKPTLSVAERLQRANAELTELQEAVKAKKAEIKELRRAERPPRKSSRGFRDSNTKKDRRSFLRRSFFVLIHRSF